MKNDDEVKSISNFQWEKETKLSFLYTFQRFKSVDSLPIDGKFKENQKRLSLLTLKMHKLTLK